MRAGPDSSAPRLAWHRQAPRGPPCCAVQQQINRLCRKRDGLVLLHVKVPFHSVIQEQLQHPLLHIVTRDSDFLGVTPLTGPGIVLKSIAGQERCELQRGPSAGDSALLCFWHRMFALKFFGVTGWPTPLPVLCWTVKSGSLFPYSLINPCDT
jgi:hypothetical protein